MTPDSDSPGPRGRGPNRPFRPARPGAGYGPGPRPGPSRPYGAGPGAGPGPGPGTGRPYGGGSGPGRSYGGGGGGGYGGGPGAGPGSGPARPYGGGPGSGRPFRPRVSFRPDGSERFFDQPRAPRPGRQERDAIRSGQRPFFRNRRPLPGEGAPEPGGRPEWGQGPAPSPRSFDRGPVNRRPAPGGGRGPMERRPPAGGPRFGSQRGWAGDPDAGPPRGGRDSLAEREEFREGDADSGEMRSNVDLAIMIIEKATARIPADLLLRQTLSRRKRLTREDSAWISRAVFSYYRWLQWLPAGLPLADALQNALELADAFAAKPNQVSDAELVRRAVPEWVSEQVAVTPGWARAIQHEPNLWLRARRSAVADVRKHLQGAEPSPFPQLPEALLYRGFDDLFRDDLFQAGAFEIQDIASQAVGLVCAPKSDETWWDACAGEGGKTLHLSDLMGGKGLIWASDRSTWRLNRLKLRAGRAGCFNYRSVVWDGSEKLPTKTLFDGILVDAPCTGLGTWGRNPHSRWTVTPKDVAELAEIQKRLLANAAKALKPGGRLIYTVCTLTRAETVDVASWFTEQHPELEPLPLVNPFAPNRVPMTGLTLAPEETQGNGMFLAGWRRRAVAEAKVAPEPQSSPTA